MSEQEEEEEEMPEAAGDEEYGEEYGQEEEHVEVDEIEAYNNGYLNQLES